MRRRTIAASLQLAALTAGLATFGGIAESDHASAQSYPSGAIKIILPFSAGSPPDTLVRLIGQQLSSRLGKNIIIENRPGAGTTIATNAVATAEPDGYTLLGANSAIAYAKVLYPNIKYDPINSFAPVATIASWSHILVVPANAPAKSAQELIAQAKANRGHLSVGFPLGSPPHILAGLLNSASDGAFNPVPYRQVSQLTTDLLAGRIQVYFGAGPMLLSLLQQGKVKALAYAGATRHSLLPNVPTMRESGLAQITLDPGDWVGIMAPAGTPTSVIDRLNAAINEGLRSPEVKVGLSRLGSDAHFVSPKEFSAFLAAEVEKWPSLARTAGLGPL